MDEFKNLRGRELHVATVELVKQERKISIVIVRHLKEIDRRRLWAELGYSSLFEYCTKALGYSESQAYRRISALKLIRDVPQIEEKIVSGELNLTTITQVQTFFNQEAKIQNRKIQAEEKLTVLEAIAGKTQKETAIELAKLNPDIPRREIERPIGENQTQIQFTADDELKNKFARLRELLAHQISPSASYSDLLHKISDIALQKLEPKPPKIKKELDKPDSKPMKNEPATRNSENHSKLQSRVQFSNIQNHKHSDSQHTASAKRLSVATKPLSSAEAKFLQSVLEQGRRRYIPIEIKRAVWHRDESRCTYRDPFTGLRCACRSGLQLDHIIPLAKGGDDSVENLRLLCRAHNQFQAIRDFGRSHMTRFISELS